jgi:deoxyribodipyrimidine photo-lyase
MIAGIPDRLLQFEPSHTEALRRIDALHPARYALSRNALDGAVSGLSPYFTHGVIGLRQAVARVVQRHRLNFEDKLMFEFAWREFFHHVWSRQGEQVLSDMRSADLWPGVYASGLPADIREGRTGVPAIDAAVRQLYATGYLHNHARMWLASYVVHLRKVHWRAGAEWLYGHLLDGDVPSNHLSWQWVAATFSSKPYLFNADNVAKYAPQGNLKAWVSKGSVIDQSYEALEHIARVEADVGPQPGQHAGVAEPALLAAPPVDIPVLPYSGTPWGQRSIELIHPWAMSERSSSAGNTGAWRLGVVHLPAHAALPWSELRWRWVMQRLLHVSDGVFIGDVSTLRVPGHGQTGTCAAPMPGYDAALRAVAEVAPAPRLLLNPQQPCRSFSTFYEQVKRQSRSLPALLNGELL